MFLLVFVSLGLTNMKIYEMNSHVFKEYSSTYKFDPNNQILCICFGIIWMRIIHTVFILYWKELLVFLFIFNWKFFLETELVLSLKDFFCQTFFVKMLFKPKLFWTFNFLDRKIFQLKFLVAKQLYKHRCLCVWMSVMSHFLKWKYPI